MRDRGAVAGALAVVLAIGAATGAGAADPNRACGLVTAAELGAALGAKVSGLKGSGMAGVELCSTSTPAAAILLRLAKKGGGPPGAAAKGIEIAKQMGAQVEVKTFGPITCSTLVPPKGSEQMGFNTTCSVSKGTELAAIEVTAKAQKDMVPIDTLRRLAEKMAGRF